MLTQNRKNEILKEIEIFTKYNSVIEIIEGISELTAVEGDIEDKFPGKKTSGLIYKDGETYKIIINENDSENRKGFTLAHELGHYILHRKDFLDKGNAIVDDILFRDNSIPSYIEEEANFFAAELLMPTDLIKDLFKKYPDTFLLSKAFSVSEEAMKFRLKNLKLI